MRLRDVQVAGDVGEQSDGHEFGCIEHEGGKRQTHERQPVPQRHNFFHRTCKVVERF